MPDPRRSRARQGPTVLPRTRGAWRRLTPRWGACWGLLDSRLLRRTRKEPPRCDKAGRSEDAPGAAGRARSHAAETIPPRRNVCTRFLRAESVTRACTARRLEGECEMHTRGRGDRDGTRYTPTTSECACEINARLRIPRTGKPHAPEPRGRQRRRGCPIPNCARLIGIRRRTGHGDTACWG